MLLPVTASSERNDRRYLSHGIHPLRIERWLAFLYAVFFLLALFFFVVMILANSAPPFKKKGSELDAAYLL